MAEKTSSTESNPEENSTDTIVLEGDLVSVDWESMVGKQVRVDGELVVVDTYDLARRGQVKLARKRLFLPTSYIDPNDSDPDGQSFEGGSNVAKVTAAQRNNDDAVITVDDDTEQQNVFPPNLFPELGKSRKTIRVGAKVSGLAGTVKKSNGRIVLVATEPLVVEPAGRPSCPSLDGADLTVASFNVLNYFTTLSDGNNDARGANTESELERQEAKIVAAIKEMKADVIGLMEIENNVEAEQRLIKAINQAVGSDMYAGVGRPEGFTESPGGSDDIRVGMIYRKDRVEAVGEPQMIDDAVFFVARTPVVQTFRSIDGGEPVTVIVNHFKSKGGNSDANQENKQKGDGQAAYNAARRKQAFAITDYISGLQSDARVLVIGDLNAYQQEDPIDALRARGLVDLHEQVRSGENTAPSYSYVYYGQCGSLDHAFATASLADDVTAIATWHINADEPRFVDYNEEYNPASLYEPSPYRSSDHDPVLIGIRNK
ncbi:MAG: ExeM/NucH family extracellular endonuclease [Planctomycetota bacterium]